MKTVEKLLNLFCKHTFQTNKIVISGYGYTQYDVRFCIRCGKLLWKQTHFN